MDCLISSRFININQGLCKLKDTLNAEKILGHETIILCIHSYITTFEQDVSCIQSVNKRRRLSAENI